MKKLILTLITFSFLLSCSKSDDNENPNLAITYQNLAGKWFFSRVLLADGSTVAFEGECPSNRDYAEFFDYRKIQTVNFYNDCVLYNNYGCPEYQLTNTNKIIVCNDPFDNATITELTNETLRLDYDGVKNLGFMSSYTSVKGLIFTRQ